jgi:hypothetical protein
MAYLKRPLNTERKFASARRRIDVNSEDEYVAPKKRIRDGYGCMDLLPVCLPDGETVETLTAKHHQLKAMYHSNSWSQSEVAQLMNSTYILQRQDLVGSKPLTVRDHVQRVSAKHGVKDDFAFLWEHAIFRHQPNKNHLTNRSEILHS